VVNSRILYGSFGENPSTLSSLSLDYIDNFRTDLQLYLTPSFKISSFISKEAKIMIVVLYELVNIW